MWNGKSAISALWMVRTRTSLLMLHATLRLLLSWSGCRSWCIICWSSEQNYSRHGMLMLFWLLFPKTCKILQVCQGSKLKGVQDSCFQVRFVFFFGKSGEMNQSISGFGNATFIITTTWRHCVVPLKPWYQWHGLGGWRSGMRWEHGLAFW